MASFGFYVLILVLLSYGIVSKGASKQHQNSDKVVRLPGQPQVSFNHYSGYIRIQVKNVEKSFFYWFIEAEVDPAAKPLILWLNGGPGCSSVGIGALQELGPFRVSRDSRHLHLNNYSWNKVANLLFLDSPVSTGFSYSNATDGNIYGDDIVANDSYAFLVKWFMRYPQYKSHDFYLAGESYAGHYVPQLAEVITSKNKRSGVNRYIKLKGLIIGNPALDEETEYKGKFESAYYHSLISDELFKQLQTCDLSKNKQTNECYTGFNKYDNLKDLNIDMYSLYTPTCPDKDPIRNTMDLEEIPGGYDNCLDKHAINYLNNPEAQKALHADLENINRPWVSCNGFVSWDLPLTVLPTVKKLIDEGIRIWVYSGDTDAVVPATSTRYAFQKLKLNVTKDWAPWFNGKEVGGWTIEYAGVYFATVRGAGHEVPVFAPQRALLLISHFLSNQRLPSVSH